MQHRRAYARLEANHDKRKFNFDIEKMAKSRYYTHYIKITTLRKFFYTVEFGLPISFS
jgi:hypothetical protein